ncbi:MAG: oxidoreductase [Chitinophagaceae bacterium]|nr:oxidoreductase [Chitinophagaceae bacterium]
MSLEWQTGKVVSIIDETHNTRRFFIETPSSEPFVFKPGQFVTLDLPIHEKKNKRWRSYSIASAPDTTNMFELVVVLVEDGAGSGHLFRNVVVGDEMVFRGPAGVFTLPQDLEHDYFMICTGTGIAPFRSMIHHIYNYQIPCKNIYLIFGTRTQKDLLYHHELKSLTEKVPHLHYIPVLSREQWEGKSGYVHDVYKELCAGNTDAHFLLCGWKNMIDDARHHLEAMGYDKKQVHFELYG